ncbi:MAG: 50S ribosomal protein L30 [Bryobacterales bacterium]|nr:50S ribosomal protein L30 [Bryobacterales bacterium]MDE0261759.1 50S ribosomal protein L30 [Bryobacterales bacterium]MDE0623908.1 50S ribosomal protein L30 [Bryobacterales bacterium]
MVKIRLKRSTIGVPAKLKRVVQGLGLRKIGQVVEHPEGPATRGMVAKVPHLVEVID